MSVIFIDAKTEASFERLAARLGRPVEEIPELGIEFLTWYADKREQGFELLLGLRDDPDDQDQVRLFRVPEFRLVHMDEEGVTDLGGFDLKRSSSQLSVSTLSPVPEQAPAPEPVCPSIVLDDWDNVVFLEASRLYFRGDTVRSDSLVYALCVERANDRSGRYADADIWNRELRMELKRMVEATFVRLSEAGCFSVLRTGSDAAEYHFTPKGMLLSDKLYGN